MDRLVFAEGGTDSVAPTELDESENGEEQAAPSVSRAEI